MMISRKKGSKEPRMKAWIGLWKQYKMAKGKNNTDAIRTYAMELAMIAHDLIKNGWIDYIPIFPELSGHHE